VDGRKNEDDTVLLSLLIWLCRLCVIIRDILSPREIGMQTKTVFRLYAYALHMCTV